MNVRTVRIAFVVAAAGLTAALTLGLAPQSVQPKPPTPQPAPGAGAGAFTIDSVHSTVIFKIGHEGVSNFYGRFNEMTGTYALDMKDPARSRFDLLVKAESVDTASERRDSHLRSPDFFNAAEFPLITFKSTKVEAAGENQLKVTGDLTMHGVSKPITADVTVFPAKQTRQGFKSGFDATFTVKRSDFGMETYIATGGLGDEVTLRVGGEGAQARSES